MSPFIRTVLILLTAILPFLTRAQHSLPEANALLDAEQIQFNSFLSGFRGDSSIAWMMQRFAGKSTDSLQREFTVSPRLEPEGRATAVTAIRYFLQSLRAGIFLQRYDLYDVPDALEKFPLVADAVVYEKDLRSLMLGMGARRTQLMADALRQYPAGRRFQHLADVRRIAGNLEMILPMVEQRKDFPYTDTALVYVAERAPMYIIEYITFKNNRITDSIYKMKHPLLRQLVTLKDNRNASEIAPLVGEMAAGRLTADSILWLRRNNVKAYFQLLVNTIQANRSGMSGEVAAGMQPALRDALRQKAMAFFIRPINELHEKADAVRFASVQSLRPIDLYYLMTSGEDELYTSSFLGIYKRMMAQLPEGGADSLMEIVGYDQFRKFIRIAAQYNVLTDWLRNMPEESGHRLLARFMGGIENSTDNGVEEAMDVADAFGSLGRDSIYKPLVASLLDENLERCRQSRSHYGERLYTILKQVFWLSDDPVAQQAIYSKLGNYEQLPVDAVRDGQNIINQLVVFYGDQDGKASFESFMSLFKDTAAWEIRKNEQWVEIRSKSAQQKVRLFANLPLDNNKGLDEEAQRALLDHMTSAGVKPGVVIHRGHSYHLPTTLGYLQPSVKLAFLGSCGGYKNLLTIAGKSPDAQILATRQIGSKLINDPMIQALNDSFLLSRDIHWPAMWDSLGVTFSKSESTRELFNDYVPPYRNLSLFVVRLYNFDASSL